MNLLQMTDANKQFGLKVLFDQARFSINMGEHVGVIGPNGAGKTTLFKILVGQERLDEGLVTKSNQLKIGYLEQEAHEPSHLSAESYLENTCTKPLWEIKQLGEGLGLTEQHFQSHFHELSGGYRMRMKLLALIGNEPNLMLLDEPTNYLDLESVLALEKFLQNYEGAFLLISHDREFLRRTTDHTLEVEQGEITKFPGHIDQYFEQKAQVRAILEAQASNQEKQRKHLQSFVDRFGAKATKAKQAQSRVKQIAKMEKIELKDLPVRAKIHVPEPQHTGKDSFSMFDASLGYEDKKVIHSCNLRLKRGDHLGVVGFNGAGKSTFLKTLAGRLSLLGGRLEFGHQVRHSYFAQHVAEELTPESTVFQCLQEKAHPSLSRQEILNMAGSLLFPGEDIHKKISVLSGGEKSRVALGQVLLQRNPLLLLDEPTNHLDFDTVEALTEALRDYTGSVIVVSHDRSFIGRISNKILEIRNGRAEIYPGTYDDYLWSLENGALKERHQQMEESHQQSSTNPAPTIQRSNKKSDLKKIKSEMADLRKLIGQQENELEQSTLKISQLNSELLALAGEEASKKSAELYHLGEKVQVLEESLLENLEMLEALKTQK